MAIPRSSLLGEIQNVDFITFVNRVIAFAIIGAGLLSVIFIFVGGISFILSGGNEEKIKTAVSTIRYAIIGLIITILAVIIVNTVGRLIGLNAIQYLNFAQIVELIQQISDDIKGSSSGGRLQ